MQSPHLSPMEQAVKAVQDMASPVVSLEFLHRKGILPRFEDQKAKLDWIEHMILRLEALRDTALAEQMDFTIRAQVSHSNVQHIQISLDEAIAERTRLRIEVGQPEYDLF